MSPKSNCGNEDPFVALNPDYAKLLDISRRVCGLPIDDFKSPPAGTGPGGVVTIFDIASENKIRTRRVTLHRDWWNHDCGKIVGFVDGSNEPVALEPRRNGGYVASFGSFGEKQRVTASFAAKLSPSAIVFYRGLDGDAASWRRVLLLVATRTKRELRDLTGIIFFLTASAFLTPFLIKNLIETLLVSSHSDSILTLAFSILSFSIISIVFDVSRSLTALRLEAAANEAVMTAIWDRLLSLPASFFRQRPLSELASRISGLHSVRGGMSAAWVNAFYNAALLLVGSLVLFWFDPFLAAVSYIELMVFLIFGFLIIQRILNASRRQAELRDAVESSTYSYVAGLAKIRAQKAEGWVFSTWLKGNDELCLATRRLANYNSHLGVLSTLAPAFSLSVTFFLAWNWAGNRADEYVAFCAAWGLLLFSTVMLVRSISEVAQLAPMFERLSPVFNSKPELSPLNLDPGILSGRIEVEQVDFSYRVGSKAILRGLNLHINDGEFLAIVGASGGGKTTLLRLLLGFERPDVGSIRFDSRDLGVLDVEKVRRQIGVVLQDGRLFSGDLKSNILGVSGLSLDDAWKAARACGIAADIEAMPMGMHTLVAEGGPNLSGGQRQRLLIARAVVGNPRILLLDEATSALDNQTQAIVSKTLDSFHGTRIVVAHRLSTVMRADRIVVMNGGRIAQSGTFSELCKQDGIFQRLVNAQIID